MVGQSIKMKVKTIIVFTVALIMFITAINLFSDNITLLSKLPENRVEQARAEALQKPFTSRPHRLERRPRLEVGEPITISYGAESVPGASDGNAAATKPKLWVDSY